MLFEQPEDRKLKIHLTCYDLLSFQLTYDQFDLHGLKTRKALRELLRLAEDRTNFRTDEGRLLVEALPAADDGCTLLLTVLDSAGAADLEPLFIPLLFQFEEFYAVYTACQKLFAFYCHRIHHSALYLLQDRYILLLRLYQAEDPQLTALLCEYAQPIGRGELAAAYLDEHGSAVLSERAVDTLAYYLS